MYLPCHLLILLFEPISTKYYNIFIFVPKMSQMGFEQHEGE